MECTGNNFRGDMSEYRNFSIIGVQTRQDRLNRSSVTGCMLVGQLFVKLVYVKLHRAALALCMSRWYVSRSLWLAGF